MIDDTERQARALATFLTTACASYMSSHLRVTKGVRPVRERQLAVLGVPIPGTRLVYSFDGQSQNGFKFLLFDAQLVGEARGWSLHSVSRFEGLDESGEYDRDWSITLRSSSELLPLLDDSRVKGQVVLSVMPGNVFRVQTVFCGAANSRADDLGQHKRSENFTGLVAYCRAWARLTLLSTHFAAHRDSCRAARWNP